MTTLTPKTHSVSDQEIIEHYRAGYSVMATTIMLDVPEARVRRIIENAGISRKRSGIKGLIFSIKHADFVPRDFVWSVDEIVSRRVKGETWASIHRSMKIHWHLESVIRYVTAQRPDVKVKGKGVVSAKTLSDAQIEQALRDHEGGESYRSILRRIKVSQTHFFRQLRDYKRRTQADQQ